MAKHTLARGDVVYVKGQGFVRYLVSRVDEAKKTADLKTVASPIVLHRDVAWSKIFPLDESQNPVRIVQEATVGK